MGIAKVFFVQEITRLRRNIERLDRMLEGCDPQAPRHSGQYHMLENEKKSRELLLDLAEHASNLGALQSELRIRYLMEQRKHNASRTAHPINGSGPTVEWWDTLGRMQYLCELLNTLTKLLKHYTPEQIEDELQKTIRLKDVAATAARADIFRAMAKADATVSSYAHLIRHDVHTTGE